MMITTISIRPMSLLAIAACAVLLSGCGHDSVYTYGAPESPAILTHRVEGGLIGAEFGGRYGTAASAAPERTKLGAAFPGNPGRGLPGADLVYVQEAGKKALESSIGQTTIWSNPQTGDGGSITPIREGESTIGSQCRQFHMLNNIKGQIDENYGTACMQPDGMWVVTN